MKDAGAVDSSSTVAEGLVLWPASQRIEALPGAPAFALTRFRDAASYHQGLIARLQSLSDDPARVTRRERAGGGIKIYHIHQLQAAELDFVSARACALFKKVLGVATAVIDMSWANIYGKGDYSLPHSHLRAQASVVYCVDHGESDAGDRWSGEFCFIDPRLAACCPGEPEYVTDPLVPGLRAGTMLIFPGQAVHCVAPYTGDRPRITLSWNINTVTLPGNPETPASRQFDDR